MIRAIISTLMFALLFWEVTAQDTFSIVAVDPETGEVGSAGASCVDLSGFGLGDDFLGELFPNQGAINSQAYYIPQNQNNARFRMNAGDSPQEIIDWLLANDVDNTPEFRQYGIVGFTENGVEVAGHTGTSTDDYKGHIEGSNYCIQGNILLGEQVLNNMAFNFENAEGDLACKLMAAMQGANIIGADTRCTDNGSSSLFAFLKVAQPDDNFGSPSFLVSVRTEDGSGIEPIDSLQILFDEAKNCEVVNTTDELIDIELLRLYPNPFTNKLKVDLPEGASFRFAFQNVEGAYEYGYQYLGKGEFDVSILPSGVYMVTLEINDVRFNQKVVKR